jgi:nucleoside transporter
MFLQYAVPGAWVPVFTLRLTELAFTPIEIGWACAGSALAALVGPLIAGQVADRWFPAQRCVAGCALIGGCLLWLVAELTMPAAVFWVVLAFWLVMVPATTLTISICFTHLSDPERSYAPVRMWGTVGWVVPGLLLGLWFAEPPVVAALLGWLRPHAPRSEWADALRLGGLLAFTLAVYALTLPHTPPTRSRKGAAASWLAPLVALRLLRRRDFAVYCVCALAGCVAMPFTSQLTSLLLQDLGVPKPWITPTLTLAQSMEVVTLATLPLILLRFGVRGTMLLGLFAWTLALTVLAVGEPASLVIASLGLNGVFIRCFLVAGQVFVNNRARGDIRASSQALLTFVNGVGMLLGNVLVGWVRQQAGGAFGPTFATAAAFAAFALLLFMFGFTDPTETPPPPQPQRP